MEEMSVVHTVALYGFLLSLLFGAIAYKTDFCTMGAVSDWVSFGIATVLGLVSGSFLAALFTRRFSLEGFTSVPDMRNHVIGGVLMGVGGVVGFGCTIGQGVTGMSTLSIGSALTLIAILFGSALTMKFQYHRTDKGFLRSIYSSLAEFRLLPAPNSRGT